VKGRDVDARLDKAFMKDSKSFGRKTEAAA